MSAVIRCTLPSQVKTDALLMSDTCDSICAHVLAVRDDVSLPESMFPTQELNSLLKESTDVFDLELGCTNIIHHAIDTDITSNHHIGHP